MSDPQATAPVEYRPIPGFPFYRVGSDGTVQSCRTRGGQTVPWRNMTTFLDQEGNRGRLFVSLRRQGEKGTHRKYVHRLVLAAFVGPKPPGMEGCHNDGNPFNNYASNLRYDTHKANCQDREAHGRTARGSRSGSARLTEAQVAEIRRLYAAGEGDQYQLAERFGVGQSTIGRIVRREQWRHVQSVAGATVGAGEE